MSAFYCEVEIDGRAARAVHVKYEAYRTSDQTGRPSSVPRPGKVHITVETTDSTKLFDNMADGYTPFSATIKYYKTDSKAIMKTVTIKNAYVVNYEESFDDNHPIPCTETVVLTAEKISQGGTEIDALWAKQ